MNKTIYLDIETTGFSRQWNNIIEIAAIMIDEDSNEILDTFHSYAKPPRKIPAEIVALTGITDAMVADCPSEMHVLMDFSEWVKFSGATKLVGHNCKSFDLAFIKERCAYLRVTWDVADKEVVDTLVVARALKKDGLITTVDCKQPTLAKYFNINYNAHSAIEDVKALIKIHKQMKELQNNDVGF